MDIIDNLIYANCASALRGSVAVPGNPFAPPQTTFPGNRIASNFIATFMPTVAPVVAPTAGLLGMPDNVGSTLDPVYSYDLNDKMNFCAFRDPDIIEDSVRRHWYDIDDQTNYDSDGIRPVTQTNPNPGQNRYSRFANSSMYHLIYAYLTENTRMLQIFERMIEKYLHDEDLGIADNTLAFNWIQNSERLFFKNDSMSSSIVRSLILSSADASRRNAYWRMFGMDLAFGDINSPGASSTPYVKASTANLQFIPLFEKFLSEVWQAYINARNATGVNTADYDVLSSLATDLRELLSARRGASSGNTYGHLNLSREEFASVLITSWFTFIISDDTPVVQFLRCQSTTIGERLIKIGNKVGIPAHRKSQDLFEMAGAAANIIRRIEDGGTFDNAAIMTSIIQSLNPPVVPPLTANQNLMTDLLTIINYWEKATGHRIKNPESNIRGTVSIAPPRPSNGRPVVATPSQ
jgi:hypothetical protein